MPRGGRVGGVEYAEPVNAAAGLVAAGIPVAEAARVLPGGSAAGAPGPPLRGGRGPVGSRGGSRAGDGVHGQGAGWSAQRVREHARASGRSISAVVAQALEEFLARGHRHHPRR